jgi:hypothetical protein
MCDLSLPLDVSSIQAADFAAVNRQGDVFRLRPAEAGYGGHRTASRGCAAAHAVGGRGARSIEINRERPPISGPRCAAWNADVRQLGKLSKPAPARGQCNSRGSRKTPNSFTSVLVGLPRASCQDTATTPVVGSTDMAGRIAVAADVSVDTLMGLLQVKP